MTLRPYAWQALTTRMPADDCPTGNGDITMTNDTQGLRHIALEGAFNVRDVGGYATHDGRTTRWRRLLRSDSLHRLTPDAQRALIDYGVRTIIDLRRSSEVARQPNVFAAAAHLTYRNVPLFDDDQTDIVEKPAQTLDELYRLWVEHCHDGLRGAMAGIAAAGDEPVLVHCMVGKDRTGLVVALALGAAGVPHDTIADDYAMSYTLLEPLFAEWRRSAPLTGAALARAQAMSYSHRDAMLELLAHLDERYGGVEAYLRAIGLTAEQIASVRRQLVG
jgi:protein-tyrosine phosphatase